MFIVEKFDIQYFWLFIILQNRKGYGDKLECDVIFSLGELLEYLCRMFVLYEREIY